MADPFTLQLHITDACQLRCRHCYRDEPKTDLPLADLEWVLDDFRAFCESRLIPGRVTFAGGEPLLRLDDLLRLTKRAKKAGMQAHLLTNGISLTADVAAALKSAGCLRAQVSIDGNAVLHDQLRGAGAYARAVAALDTLSRARLPATVSMTLGAWNLSSLDEVIRLAQQHEARLFVSRFVPCGTGATLRDKLLPANEWRAVMRRCRALSRRHAPGVALRDPLYAPLRTRQERGHDLALAGCAVGHAGLAVEADGEAYACRRLAIPLGNVRTSGFESIWQSPLLDPLRDRDRLKGRCGACRRRWQCGGCRAIAHALTGDPLAADPQCPWSPH